MKNKSKSEVKSCSRFSVSKAKSSVKEQVEELVNYFPNFGFQERELPKVLDVLSLQRFPEQIPCRNYQIEKIEEFITTAISQSYSPQVLYIGGIPGIGKTLCVKNVVKKFQKKQQNNTEKVIFIQVNAMKVKEPQDIFKAILFELTKTQVKLDALKSCYILNDYFVKSKCLKQIKVPPSSTKILIIDEMDYLKTEQQQVIYTIVEWIRSKKSHLSIIGISNIIDLPQTFSLKIASRFGSKRLIFPQYTIAQISQILNERLKECQGLFDTSAIQYICNKIGGQQTDIRRCLHILRQSINKHLGKSKLESPFPRVSQIDGCIVQEVVKQFYHDTFVNSFHDFPLAYKLVLMAAACYFRQEKQILAYSQLQHLLGNNIIYSVNQLRSILFDLKDLGLIQIKYMTLKNDNRITKDFNIPKNVEEQYINLLVGVDKIMIAAEADQRQTNTINPLQRLRMRLLSKKSSS